jgi:hypothetical protein
VLDSNEKKVYSSLLSHSTVIYDDSQNLAYTQIDGGYNYPAFTVENGGVIKTNKSITLSFTNVDTKYSYLRLKVMKYSSGDKITKSSHLVATLIPITSGTLEFTYTGYNTANGDTTIDNSDLTVLPTIFDSCSYMEQVQNRLIRGNIREKNIDYSTFQSFANSITTQYTVKEVEFKDATAEGNDKNPLTYQDYTGYMSDEIYAFGIVYVFTDGSLSPVFHIPGRASVATDLVNITVGIGVPVDNVKHINSAAVNGDLIPTWQLLNTANTATRDMGYYQDSQTTYPNTVDCNGNFIWGALRGTPVRHHRFPDRQQVPLVSTNNMLNVLGVQFSNVTFPIGTVDYFFVRSTREEANKTVLDAGYNVTKLTNNASPNTAIEIDTFRNSNNPTAELYSCNVFVSPKTYLTKEFLSGTHLKNVFNLQTPVKPNGYNAFEPYENVSADEIYPLTHRYYYGTKFYNSALITYTTGNDNNHTITNAGYINPTSTSTQFINSVANRNFLGSIFTLKTITEINRNVAGIDQSYCYLKNQRSVYSNIFNLVYERIGNINQNICFNGDVFLSTTPIVFGKLDNTTTQSAGENFRTPNFGDFFIDWIFESEINSGLRHSTNTTCGKYYQNTKYVDFELLNNATPVPIALTRITGDMSKYIYDKFMTEAEPQDLYKSVFCTEERSYNLDFNKISNPQLFFPIELSFDYCSTCINQYKQRIVYSEKSFTEEKQDAYLIFKTNNYIDLPGNRGEITGLKYKEGLLLAHTRDATFILKPNPQILTTNQSDIYLGTGDFLSIPAQELIQTDLGYAGCQSRMGMCNTPYGYCWVDEKAGQVFMFDKSLEDISQIGMSGWFKEHLPEINTDTILNTTLDNAYFGSGVRLTYDPRFKRLILSKLDYKNLSVNPIQYDAGFNRFRDTVTGKVVLFDNIGDFENKSFTLSFSFLFKSWTSFHSYLPLFYWYNEDTFWSTITGNSFYTHDVKNVFRLYYGNTYPFIVEYFTHDFITHELQSVEYVAQTKNWDLTNESWIENKVRTFTKLWCYNKTQSTGILDLTLLDQLANPFGNLPFSFTAKNVIKSDKNYKIASIYSNREISPSKTNIWATIQLQYPIDYLPLPNEVIEQTALRRIKDKECFIRLIKDDIFVNDKLSLYLSSNQEIISVR